ncbi:Signal transduction histidine kinase [Thermomonospora echinospora]|uniref:histidine kinase n=1 Tax=Thermomonospora echinospora TaxID=1992 RepID=A0A1H5X794_9ACTN|nr:nitrate- and nitrite sensing domain-containing protein [Thermomonospora echinospora]SEG07619.1 Signal transduction histidine kinase [Thermomonospora echinospora]
MQPIETGGDAPRPGDAGAKPDPSPRRGGRLLLRNWRVPQRLVVLVLIPTVAALVLGGLRISASTASAEAYGRVERMAQLGNGVTTLVQEFAAERDLTVAYIADGRSAEALAEVRAQYKKVDAVTGRVRQIALDIDESYSAEATADARRVLGRVDGVRSLRSIATTTQVPAFTVLEKYSESIDELIGILDGVSQDVADDRLAESSRSVAALARAKEQVSRQRALLVMGTANRRLTSDELSALVGSRAREDSELVTFRQSATLEQRQMLDDTVVGAEIDRARELRQQAISGATSFNGLLPREMISVGSARSLRAAMTAMVDQMRSAERRLGDELLDRARQEKSAARSAAVTDAGVTAAIVLLVLLITSMMARSLVRPLNRLRDGALEVAGTRLPGLVERLRDPQAAAGGIEVEPIEIDTTDEIGQVARAFDEVHREAVRLAADEAVLRGNINAMFVNLSRRMQSLIERQLRLIDELEQSEQDEEQLASLFQLDHLATRMRRNCENLLVLGGQEQVRRWNQPVPLIDIVRASLSEVEQYERIALRVQGEVSVTGQVVNDLVHLVAELVENATVFSPQHTKVTVSGHLLSGGGAMLQITDNGVGISPEDLEQANWRLANPPVIDFSAARRMGLFVVGRLAVRHGIRVELRPALSGGITAFVLLPSAVIARGEEPAEVAPHRGDDQPVTSAAWTPTPVAAGVQSGSTGPMPALGTGRPGSPLGRRDGFGTGPQPTLRDSGPQPSLRDSGPLPLVGDAAVPPPRPPSSANTGAQPVMGAAPQPPPLPPERETAPLPATGSGGPRRRVPGDQTGPQPIVSDTGPQQPPIGQPMLAARLPGFPAPGPEHARPSEPPPAAGLSYPGPDAGRPPGQAAPPPRGRGTGPQPVVSSEPGVSWGAAEDPQPAAPPAGGRERSPIFDAMESEWFQRRTDDGGQTWQSAGDAGWQAAQAAREPTAGGTTKAGLPKRVPGRNRVPGAVGRQPAAAPARPAAPPPAQPADRVRDRFASLQRGVHRGRSETRSGLGPPGDADEIAPPGTGGAGPAQGDTERGGSA